MWLNFSASVSKIMPRSRRLNLSTLLVFALLWLPEYPASAQEPPSNLVLVTLDGVRWQEVFGGIDMSLIEDERSTAEPELLKETYWREQRAERREQLFPFLWSVINSQGVLVGDRREDSYMEVTNPWWFSYPGYNEILTGRADPDINSNDKNWNPNVSFLEILNGVPEFKNRVLAFGSWDVFPYILNTQRSGFPVNAGFSVAMPATTDKTRWLNHVSAQAPRLWKTVRLDFITHGYAMEALKTQQPRVTYISYGETDDFAHDGSYDRYIDAAYRTDQMLSELWTWLQADPFYRDRTTLLITTDHGRGSTAENWRSHSNTAGPENPGARDAASFPLGSEQIWFAAIGPHVKSGGLVAGHWNQSQIAATALRSLNLDPAELMPTAGEPMEELLQ